MELLQPLIAGIIRGLRPDLEPQQVEAVASVIAHAALYARDPEAMWAEINSQLARLVAKAEAGAHDAKTLGL